MVIIIIIILLGIAFFTLLERKILGYSQLRKGPNKVSVIGLLQPIADAIKLFLKQNLFLVKVNWFFFLLSPIIALVLALLLWLLYPFYRNGIIFLVGVFYFLRLSRVNVYTILLAGWVSNSKYALLGRIRSIAQTISYEVSIRVILISPLMFWASIRTLYSGKIIMRRVLLLPLMIIWLVTLLAETNRTPFDLAEGESELVSGFNTEYGSGVFALIFIAEYINILALRIVTSFMFLNGVGFFLNLLFIGGVGVFFLWSRTTLPRIRYDQLITIAWKSLLVLSLRVFVVSFILRGVA